MTDKKYNIVGGYKELSNLFRRTITQEINTGKYQHLKSPGCKAKTILPLEDMKFRVNILPREYHKKQENGERNLSVGTSEIVLFIYGNLNYNEKKGWGIIPTKESSPFRIVCGKTIACKDLAEIVFNEIKDLEESFESLPKCDIDLFVQNVLGIINENIGVMKTLAYDKEFNS